jgi:hypothetical protein
MEKEKRQPPSVTDWIVALSTAVTAIASIIGLLIN